MSGEVVQLADGIEDSYPLAPMQQGMLYHSVSAETKGVDLEQMLCELHEELDAQAFEQAWQRVAGRHAILRTAFRWEGLDEPRQEVHRQVQLEWIRQDWRGLPAERTEHRFAEFLEQDRLRGFEMDQAPLMRFALFRFGLADYRFVWTFHHALLDGRSFPLVLKEVFAIYEALRHGEDLDLPTQRPYREHIEWLRRQDWSKAESFWRERLNGFSAPTPLVVDRRMKGGEARPADNLLTLGERASLPPSPPPSPQLRRAGRPSPQGEGGDLRSNRGSQETHLSSETTAALRAFAAANEFTLNTVVQGAWALLLSRYSGEDEVMFGVTRACRRSSVPGAESMVGLFINTLPLRVRVKSKAPLAPWLKEIRQQWVAMREYEHTPLVRIQSWSAVPPGVAPFESIVVFENFSLDSMLRGQGDAWSLRRFSLLEQTNFPLTLAAYAGAELLLRIQFDRRRLDDGTVERMLGHLRTLLEGIAEISMNQPTPAPLRGGDFLSTARCVAPLSGGDAGVGLRFDSTPNSARRGPECCLGDLTLLDDAEQLRLVEEWGAAQFESRPAAALHELFEAEVERTPHAVAVVFGNERLTYFELNRRANRLAHYLRQCGVGPEILVGVCLERSPELVIGILAVLKAGGAYVPIDLTYPAERVAFILKDTKTPVLLTQISLLSRLPLHAGKVICVDEFHGGSSEVTHGAGRGVASTDAIDGAVLPHPGPLPKGEEEMQAGLGGVRAAGLADTKPAGFPFDEARSAGGSPASFNVPSENAGEPPALPAVHGPNARGNRHEAAREPTPAPLPGGEQTMTARDAIPLLGGAGCGWVHTPGKSRDRNSTASELEANPRSGVTAGNLAYVIYTSGSTGQPKGVLVTHANVVRLFQTTESWFHFSREDVWTLFHSYAFDFSVWEIWGALLYGGKLVVVPYLMSRSPDEFHALLLQEDVTVLNQTPSAFRQLIQADKMSVLPCLRLVIFGGEALDLECLKPWFERHGDRRPQLVNMFGITETAVHVTYRPLALSDLGLGSVIGIPIPDLQAYVLDKALRPVPMGVPGELYVGGAGLGRGYLNRPELTAERFVPNALGGQPGERLYRTGDLVRWLPNRDLEYLGRIDDQVKIRGFRIELGEIEAVLADHPAVVQAAVLVREDAPGDKRLAAYFVARKPTPASIDLRNFLLGRLPEYMVPAAFVVLESFPLTTNGKINRRALAAMPVKRLETETAFEPPRTELERTIAEIWQQILRVPKVGLDENFFELGGNSLLIVQVHGKLRGALNKELPLTKLFQFPTVRALSRYMSELPDATAGVRKAVERAQRHADALAQRNQLAEELKR